MTDFAFEEISEEELQQALAPSPSTKGKTQKYDTTERTRTNWFRLPHIMGFCTVPMHDEVQELVASESEDAAQWREQYKGQRYPNRMVFTIHPYQVCRDCFIHSADIECAAKDMKPVEFDAQ